MRGKSHEYCNRLRLLCIGVCSNIIFVTACQSVKFGTSDLEKTGDARALLALCYRAQKDNAAAGGGNTRNCDDVQSEAIKHVRHEICQGAYDKKTCVCNIYKICEKKTDSGN